MRACVAIAVDRAALLGDENGAHGRSAAEAESPRASFRYFVDTAEDLIAQGFTPAILQMSCHSGADTG